MRVFKTPRQSIWTIFTGIASDLDQIMLGSLYRGNYSTMISKLEIQCFLRPFGRSGPLKLLTWIALVLATLPAARSAAAEEAASEINWSLTPYIWASDTEYDLKAGGTPVDDGKVTFDDLLDTTDTSFQIVTEAGLGGGKWSAFVDLTYLETSDSYTVPLFRVDSDSEQWFADAAIAWWPQGESGGLSVFAGCRYTDLDDSLDFILEETSQPVGRIENDRDFLDALLGVRKRFRLTDSWSLLTHADFSFGQSEGTYQLQALFRYAMGKKQQYGLIFGYRYKETKFEHDDIEEEYKYQGPLLGFNFRL